MSNVGKVVFESGLARIVTASNGAEVLLSLDLSDDEAVSLVAQTYFVEDGEIMSFDADFKFERNGDVSDLPAPEGMESFLVVVESPLQNGRREVWYHKDSVAENNDAMEFIRRCELARLASLEEIQWVRKYGKNAAIERAKVSLNKFGVEEADGFFNMAEKFICDGMVTGNSR